MTASRKSLGSDFSKVDAYVNTPADYEDIPDMADRDLNEGVFHPGGVPPRMGRPPLGDEPKKQVTLRLDKETLERFKATGPGWQTRMGVLLARNDLVIKMIRENIELIDSMESMLGYMRKGEMRMVFESIETTIARVEQNIRNVAETTNSLRDQLVVN